MVRRLNKEKRITLLNELLKDSSRSDRELAKIIGISQPTVSIDKKDFEKSGLKVGDRLTLNIDKTITGL